MAGPGDGTGNGGTTGGTTPAAPAAPATPTVDTTNASQAVDIFSKLGSVAGITKDVIDKLRQACGNLGVEFKGTTDLINATTIGLAGASKAFQNFSEQANVSNLQNIGSQFEALGDKANTVTSILKSFGGGLGTAGQALQNFSAKTIGAADNALNLQRGFFNTAQATGQLDKAFGDSGGNLENLNDLMLKHSIALADVATATGTSVAQTSSAYGELAKNIPNALTSQMTATNAAGESMNALQAVMMTATGTSRSNTAVITDMTRAYQDFGASTEDALKWTAQMSDTANKLGINFDYVHQFAEGNADAFRLISNNAGDASNTLLRMSGAFTATGLSAAQSTQIIGGMTKGLANLTTGQKAYLSAQSGGPGGLRGAFQIDNMMRNGQQDEVMQMMENNLKKQLGGRIYTQDEAGQSDQAAQAYERQIKLMQSGVFGGLVKDDATAARLSEAMKNGTNKVDALKQDPTQALSTAISRGDQLQGTTNTLLTRLVNIVERQSLIAGNQALRGVQASIGNNSAAAGYLRNSRTEATNSANEVLSQIRTNPTSVTNVKNLTDQDGQRFRDFSSGSMKALSDSISQASGRFRDKNVDTSMSAQQAYSYYDNKFKSEMNNVDVKKDSKGVIDMDDFASKASEQLEARQRLNSIARTNGLENNGNRGEPMAAQVTQAAQANARPAPETAPTPIQRNTTRGIQSSQQNPAMVLDVRMNGVVCEKCATRIHPNVHIQPTLQGTK